MNTSGFGGVNLTEYRPTLKKLAQISFAFTLLILTGQVIAGLASLDIAGQTRATPNATMGALEVASGPEPKPEPKPELTKPSGLSLMVVD